jgi:hypothetical protein
MSLISWIGGENRRTRRKWWVAFFWYPSLFAQSYIKDEWLSSGSLIYLFRVVSKMSDFLLVRWITCSEPYQRWVVFFGYAGLLAQSRIEGEWLFLVRWFTCSELYRRWVTFFWYPGVHLCHWSVELVGKTDVPEESHSPSIRIWISRIVTTIKLSKYHWEVNFFIWKSTNKIYSK